MEVNRQHQQQQQQPSQLSLHLLSVASTFGLDVGESMAGEDTLRGNAAWLLTEKAALQGVRGIHRGRKDVKDSRTQRKTYQPPPWPNVRSTIPNPSSS